MLHEEGLHHGRRAANFQDLRGLRFGRWTVLHEVAPRGRETCWRCRCECGREKDVLSRTLRAGRSRGCGHHPKPTASVRRGAGHPSWRGELASTEAGHARARRRYPLGACVRCGRPATDRHHKDADPLNNEPSNVEVLCRRCHMETDGRLEAFISARLARPPKGPQPCQDCGRPCKPRRKGRCEPCYYRSRKHGVIRNEDSPV